MMGPYPDADVEDDEACADVDAVILRFACRYCGADIGRWCKVRDSKTGRAAAHLHSMRWLDATAAGALPLPDKEPV